MNSTNQPTNLTMSKTNEGFELVTNNEQSLEFDTQWKEICKEMKNTYIPDHEKMIRYLLKEQEVYKGTVAFVPDNEEFSLVKGFFDFTDYIPKGVNVYEVGKISMKKEFRHPKNIDLIVSNIIHVTMTKNIDVICGVMNSELIAAFIRRYGVNINRIEKLFSLPKCDVYAITCDMREVLKNKKGNRHMQRIIDEQSLAILD